MGVGNVEIRVITTDVGESKSVKELNRDLKQMDAEAKNSAVSAAGIGKSYLHAQESANRAKGKIDEFLGLVSFAAPAVAVLGAALAEVFGASQSEQLLAATRQFGDLLWTSAKAADALGERIDAVADKALSSRVAVLRLLGDSAAADQIEMQRSLRVAQREVVDSVARINEVTAQIESPFVGAKAQLDTANKDLADALKQRRRLIEEWARGRNASTATITVGQADAIVGDDVAARVAAAQANQIKAQRTLAELTEQKARAEDAYATLLQTRSRSALEAQVKAAESVATSSAASLKSVSSYTSATLSLLREQGASRAAVAQAQKDEFEIKKTIGLIEAEATKASLTGELSKLEAMREQYKLVSLMRGQSTQDMADVEQALARVTAAVAAVDRYSAVLSSATYRPGGAGGGGRSAAKKDFAFASAANTDTFAAGMLGGGGADLAAEARYTASIADAEARRTDAIARRFDLLRRQAAAPAKDRGTFDSALRDAGDDIRGAQQDILSAERERERALTEIAAEGEEERRRIRKEALEEQRAGLSRVLSSAVDAFDQMESLTIGQQIFDAAARGARSLAENWSDLVAGKAGAIQAIGEETTAGIKNIKTRAALMVLVSVAEGASQAIVPNIPGVIAAGVAATAWGIVAGSGGGSGVAGRTPPRTPSVRAGNSLSAGVATIINVNAPWIGSNPQEVGAYLERQRAAVDGTGYRWAA